MAILAKMAEMAIKRQNRQIVNKNSNEMAKGPLESGDFGENGVFTKGRECSLSQPNQIS